MHRTYREYIESPTGHIGLYYQEGWIVVAHGVQQRKRFWFVDSFSNFKYAKQRFQQILKSWPEKPNSHGSFDARPPYRRKKIFLGEPREGYKYEIVRDYDVTVEKYGDKFIAMYPFKTIRGAMWAMKHPHFEHVDIAERRAKEEAIARR